MALIEHMEHDNWEETLRRFFEYTLEVLKNEGKHLLDLCP